MYFLLLLFTVTCSQITQFSTSTATLRYPIAGDICIYNSNTSLTWMCYGIDTLYGTYSDACWTMNLEDSARPTYASAFYPTSLSTYQTLTNNCVFDDEKSLIYCWTGNRLFTYDTIKRETTIVYDGKKKDGMDVKDSSTGINKVSREIYILRGGPANFLVWSLDNPTDGTGKLTFSTKSKLPQQPHRFAPSSFYNAGAESLFCLFADKDNNIIECILTDYLEKSNTGWFTATSFDVASLSKPVGIQIDNEYLYILGGAYPGTATGSNVISNSVYVFDLAAQSIEKLAYITLATAVWQSCGVFDSDLLQLFVVGGAQNSDGDGLQSIQYSTISSSSPTEKPINVPTFPTGNPTPRPTAYPTAITPSPVKSKSSGSSNRVKKFVTGTTGIICIVALGTGVLICCCICYCRSKN